MNHTLSHAGSSSAYQIHHFLYSSVLVLYLHSFEGYHFKINSLLNHSLLKSIMLQMVPKLLGRKFVCLRKKVVQVLRIQKFGIRLLQLNIYGLFILDQAILFGHLGLILASCVVVIFGRCLVRNIFLRVEGRLLVFTIVFTTSFLIEQVMINQLLFGLIIGTQLAL